MSYFADLTDYTYSRWDCRPNTVNVGWLDQAHAFEKANADAHTIARLWAFCTCSIAQTRGFHQCNLAGCSNPSVNAAPLRAARDGITLKLGSAEIRVFGSNGRIYAAPNLIYHYVSAHGYRMPEEFIEALKFCPTPDQPEYVVRLKSLNLEWSKTLSEEVNDTGQP